MSDNDQIITETVHTEPSADDATSSDRRGALRLGATVAAVGGLGVIGAAKADASAGQPVVQGAVNTVGTAGTTITSSGSAITLTGKNTGAGAAAFFFAQNNNGFAGGTGSGSKVGLSAANTGAAGTGAAVSAVGKNNTGIVCNTTNLARFALTATNLSTATGSGGGILAAGGSNPAIVATSGFTNVPSIYAVGDILAEDSLYVTLSSASVVAMYAPMTPGFPDVIQHMRVATPTATTTVTVPDEFTVVANPSAVTVMATPNSGAMPDLAADVSVAGAPAVMTLTLTGCTAGGTVSVTLAAPRQDLLGLASSSSSSSKELSKTASPRPETTPRWR